MAPCGISLGVERATSGYTGAVICLTLVEWVPEAFALLALTVAHSEAGHYRASTSLLVRPEDSPLLDDGQLGDFTNEIT